MNPGLSVWSAALNKRLKPRSHILLEPEVKYGEIMKEFTTSHPGSHWLPLDGYDWNTYSELFPPNTSQPVNHDLPPLNPKFVPPEEGINTDIIFTANLSMAGPEGERLLAQFLTCCALGQWVQKFGRVRFLIWAQDALRDRYLPRGIGGRNRAAVMAETVAEIQEVVSAEALRTGRGHPRSIKLDAEGNIFVRANKRIKRDKNITSGQRRPRVNRQLLTAEELEAMLSKIQESRISKKGHAKDKARSARNIQLHALDLERIRRRLLHVVENPVDPEVAELFHKLAETDLQITERTNEFMKTITEYLEDPETEQRWLTEMENPPWWYRKDKKRLIALAEQLARGPSKTDLFQTRHINTINVETARQIEALEELEESTDSETEQQQKFEEFQEHWARPSDITLAKQGREDEVLVFQKGMLMWGRRKFDSVISKDLDFHPAQPLALLDFSPIVLGEFFRPGDQNTRGTNWEVYLWILRSLFLLRARSLTSALKSMTPGGDHLLQMVDRNAAIDGKMRVRTLDVGQLVELTKAWRKWPFQSQGEHLDYLARQRGEGGGREVA